MTFSRAKTRYFLMGLVILAVVSGLVVFTDKKAFILGLDLEGGAQLIYEADFFAVPYSREAMAGVRDVIERRVNLFGVAEPVVQIVGEKRLLVELAGIKDTNQAIAMIGLTPALDFRREVAINDKDGNPQIGFASTGLTGKNLKRAEISLGSQNSFEPGVNLYFDEQGKDLFTKLTRENVGKRVAIFLDGAPLSVPVVQEEISSGQALISGKFTIDEAKTLAKRLNAGALPVPIKLISQQTVGASLGRESLDKSLKAGIIGSLAIALFMVAFYGFRGLAAVLALLFYGLIVLAIFKTLPVTLSLAGITGFILSIGMAVDANVLIFERLKEERKLSDAFSRAWPAIRDGNISTLFTCLILWFFTTGLIQGFALTLSIGILVSMFSALFATRVFLELKES